MKDIDLARQLSQVTGRKISLQSVRKQRQKMGIEKQPGRGVCGLKTISRESNFRTELESLTV